MNKNIKNSTASDLFLSVLIADVGTARFEKLRDEFMEKLNLSQDVGVGLVDDTQPSLGVLMDLFTDGTDALTAPVGGLGMEVIKRLSLVDLSHLDNEEEDSLDAGEVLSLVLLREASGGMLREALDFLAEQVSVKAADAARQTITDMKDVYFRKMPTDTEFADGLRHMMDSDLQGPTASEVRRQRAEHTDRAGGRPAGILTALLVGLGGLGETGGGLEESLVGFLSSLKRKSPKVQELRGLLADKLSGATIGDLWEMENVPFGLPSDVEDLLRTNPSNKYINMDGVRSTPMKMLASEEGDESMAGMRQSGAKAVAEGRLSQELSELINEIYTAIRGGIIRDHGSVENAIAKTGEWLSKKTSRFAEPTLNCDCPRCKTLIRLANAGLRVDRLSGDVVSG